MRALVAGVWLASGVASAQEAPRPSAGDTVSAARATTPIRVDGLLTDAAWRAAVPITTFTQREPFEGEPASEGTEVRVVASGEVLYVGVLARMRDPRRVVARILARDRVMEPEFDGKPTFAGDDGIAILLDPFHDHRNAFVFATNANGAEFDALLTDEGREFNVDWRGVWEVKAQRTAEGWSAEFAIPFRTLRYRADGAAWGFNVYRMTRQNNEEVLWRAWGRGSEGFARVSRAGHLVGLGGLRPARLRADLRPYALAGTDTEAQGARAGTRGIGGAGFDVKSEVRPGLVLDLSYNTDFAQVEVDDQQVNLTRFSLFFPEKREFFLENAGIFTFGATGTFEPPPFLAFFSRAIGIDPDSGAVPLLGGGRLTGRVGGQTVGVLSAVTAARFGESSRTAFNVARVKRDVRGAGYLGAMLVDRRTATAGNTVGGVDWSLWPTARLNVQGFAARTGSEGPGGEGTAWRVGAEYQAPNLSGSLSVLSIDPEARARAGFITRTDIRRTQGNVRYVLRPQALGVRRVSLLAFQNLVTDQRGERQDWSVSLGASPTWDAGHDLALFHTAGRSRVPAPFTLADTVPVPAGDYATRTLSVFGSTAPGHPVVLDANADLGEQFGGTVHSLTTGATVAAGVHLALRGGYTRSAVRLPGGAFTAHLVSARATWAFTPRAALNTLAQFNSLDRRVSVNVRFNYIYRPGSDLFLVLTEDRGSATAPWEPRARGLRLKLTWLARL